MYRLEYLPLAKQDIVDIAGYITIVLNNPSAAENLIEEMIEKADKLIDFPYINPIHTFIKPLEYEYRKLIVKNYIMFYWVDEAEKKITIARVIYERRNYGEML